MTRKQMKKLAKQISECQLIHEDKTASKEARLKAEDTILHLTNQILALHDGINILLEIDSYVQENLLKNEKE